MERYADLGNGIIRDTKTGLEWQVEPFGPASWQEQIDQAAVLDLGGHTDWRLPTIEELITLIDYSRVDPASTFPKMPSDWFWSSSSSRAASTSYAWGVSFNLGFVYSNDKTGNGHARCVRGGPLAIGDSDLRTEVERLRGESVEMFADWYFDYAGADAGAAQKWIERFRTALAEKE